jgi:hypothetical protein
MKATPNSCATSSRAASRHCRKWPGEPPHGVRAACSTRRTPPRAHVDLGALARKSRPGESPDIVVAPRFLARQENMNPTWKEGWFIGLYPPHGRFGNSFLEVRLRVGNSRRLGLPLAKHQGSLHSASHSCRGGKPVRLVSVRGRSAYHRSPEPEGRGQIELHGAQSRAAPL